jgi:hypothetical protein
MIRFLILTTFSFVGLIIHAQNNSSSIDTPSSTKVYKSIYKSYKKSRPKESATYEGFFLLKISNPFDTSSSNILSSSNEVFEKFGQSILLNINKNTLPVVSSDIKAIIVPVIHILKCKKHTHISRAEFQSQIHSILENEKTFTDSSIVVLEEITVIGYTHFNR